MKPLYRFAHVLFTVILKALFHFRVYGRNNLPRGKAIIAANHQSYVDPPVVGTAIPEEISYLAREDLFKFAPFRWLCIKVNSIVIKKGQADLPALKIVLEKLAQGGKVLVFPEGTRSYNGMLQSPEMGIAFLARYSRAPIIPAYVSGTFQVLPRGHVVLRLHPVSVSFGPPLRFNEISLSGGARQVYEMFSQRVMDAIATLKAGVEEHRVQKPTSSSPFSES